MPEAGQAVMPAAAGAREVAPAHRLEHDLLGELPVPEDAHYGIHTARALHDVLVSGVPIGRHPQVNPVIPRASAGRPTR